MTVFSAVFTAVAISAAQDLFELVAPSASRVRLLEIGLANYSDFADAEAEILPINIFRGHTVSGSGGASVTPANLNPYGRAAGATVERRRSPRPRERCCGPLGGICRPVSSGVQEDMPRGLDPFRRHILLQPSQRLVIRTTAPTDGITTNGSILFEEIGKSPVS